MPNFERMDVDELVAYRDKITAKLKELKADFIAAGKVLNVKRQDAELVEVYNRLESKRAELQEKMGMEQEPQRVNLKTILMRGKTGG